MSGFLQGAPPREQGPLVNVPAPVLLLILSFVIVHAIQMLGGEGNRLWMIFNFGLHPLHVTDSGGWATALLWFPAWIKFVSHAFLHVDLVHLAFNSLWFVVFGSIVARRTGTWRFLALFLATAMAGGLVHVLVYPESLVPVIGASGAVSGLVGASLRFILRGGGNLEDAPLMPLFAPKLMAAVLVWSVLNFVLGTIGFTPEGFGALIAWEAHMGGFLVGLLLLPFLDRPSPAPR
jgi:membrane associated rhomboid family serine protease